MPSSAPSKPAYYAAGIDRRALHPSSHIASKTYPRPDGWRCLAGRLTRSSTPHRTPQTREHPPKYRHQTESTIINSSALKSPHCVFAVRIFVFEVVRIQCQGKQRRKLILTSHGRISRHYQTGRILQWLSQEICAPVRMKLKSILINANSVGY